MKWSAYPETFGIWIRIFREWSNIIIVAQSKNIILNFSIEFTEHRVHIYDSNFFKSLYHCEGERRQEISSNEPNALVDATFQSVGGLWSGSCGSSNELDSLLSDRIVGGEETIKHQYPWMVIFHKATLSLGCFILHM